MNDLMHPVVHMWAKVNIPLLTMPMTSSPGVSTGHFEYSLRHKLVKTFKIKS